MICYIRVATGTERAPNIEQVIAAWPRPGQARPQPSASHLHICIILRHLFPLTREDKRNEDYNRYFSHLSSLYWIEDKRQLHNKIMMKPESTKLPQVSLLSLISLLSLLHPHQESYIRPPIYKKTIKN